MSRSTARSARRPATAAAEPSPGGTNGADASASKDEEKPEIVGLLNQLASPTRWGSPMGPTDRSHGGTHGDSALWRYLPYLAGFVTAFVVVLTAGGGGGEGGGRSTSYWIKRSVGIGAKIGTDKRNYAPGETIIVSFKHRDARPMDWIGIYPAVSALDKYSAATKWNFACSTADCNDNAPSTSGKVKIEGGVGREGGKFRAHLIRDTNGRGREILAESRMFKVAADTSPTATPTLSPTDPPTKEPTYEPTHETTAEE